MLKILKKQVICLVAIGLVFSSSTSSTYAKGSSNHSKDALFNFYSSKDEANDRYNEFTEEEKKNAPISNLVEDKENKANRMIVITKKSISLQQQKEIIGDYGTHHKALQSVIGFSAYVPEKNLEVLLRNSNVKDIYVDTVVTAQGYTQPLPKDVLSSDLVWEEKGYKGSGIGVAVLDSGVAPTKEISNLVAFKDFVNGRVDPYDDNGHGTHVAGIIAGNGFYSNGEIKGSAPSTNIVGVKVLDSNEKGYISNVISGIDWVIQNKTKYNIKVINLSLGTTYTGNSDPLIDAVEKATKEGILVVAAGGNNGNSGKIMSPAASDSAIAVGSTDARYTVNPKDDTLASFSISPQKVNGATKPEVYATGVDVVSALSLQGNRASNDRMNVIDGYYYQMSGTSMSVPQVTAVAALVYSQNPNQSPLEVKSKIISKGLSVQGLNVLNAASVFGITPTWEEVKEEKIPVSNEGDKEIELPITEIPKEEEGDTKNEEVKPPTVITPPSTENEVVEDKKDEGGFSKDQPETGLIEEVVENEGNTNKDSSSQGKKPEVIKVEANIPEVDEYIINNGYPFVKQTYEKRNVLKELAPKSSNYSNEKDINFEYEKISDIIKLYNLINRSFTKEDFLYFEQRLNSPPPKS